MRIGVFSVIEWSFLDQRPQMITKKLAEWGHQVVYFEPFFRLHAWSDTFDHPWSEYESTCWNSRDVYPNVKVMPMLWLPAHKLLTGIFHKNNEYEAKHKKIIASLGLDLAIVIDPSWSNILENLKIPYIYDHIDDTHQMECVLKDFWHEQQQVATKGSIATLYIQPNIARRYGGIYIPNGIDPAQLNLPAATQKDFDAGCLSAIADWFDMDSVLHSTKKLLIIGPIEANAKARYDAYRQEGNRNVTWLPRVSRTIGAHWLTRCRTVMIPFNDLHPIVDYVMPLKLVEYLYLGLPIVTYLNKLIEEEFGDVVNFYSSVNWRGLPDLDTAIDLAIERKHNPMMAKEIAYRFTWDNVFEPLKELISTIGQGSLQVADTFRHAHDFCANHTVELIRDKDCKRDISWFFQSPADGSALTMLLPPYLELYYQLFFTHFAGDDEAERKLSFLIWLMTSDPLSEIIGAGKRDPYVYSILDAKHKLDLSVNGLDVTNFEYTFLKMYSESFKEWGFPDDTLKKIIWIYTWGYSCGERPYFEHIIQKVLKDSKITLRNGFTLSIILELLVECYGIMESKKENYSDNELIIDTGYILCNYSMYKYPLAEHQIELLGGKSGLFLDIYDTFTMYLYGKAMPLDSDSNDCHPELKKMLARRESKP